MKNTYAKTAKFSLLSLLLASSCAFSHSTHEINANINSIRALTIEENKNLENSSEGGSWRVFAVQAPMCDRSTLEKYKGKISKFQRKENSRLREGCIQANKECKQAQKIATKYKVESVCSPVYSEISILTTQAQTVSD